MSEAYTANRFKRKLRDDEIPFHINIGTPIDPVNISTRWFLDVIREWHTPVTNLITSDSKPLDAARNNIIKKFLIDNPDGTHLLFWDSDIIVPPNAPSMLLSHNEPIVSGLYVMKLPPHKPLMMTKSKDGLYGTVLDWEYDKIYEVDGVGFGFVLIRRDVLQDVEYPWTLMSGISKSEDYYFFEKAQNAGYKILIDTGVVCGHIGPYPYSPRDFYQFQQGEIDKNKYAESFRTMR